MATFVEELSSHLRGDGTKNIRIAVHHNGGKQYIGTNLYVHKSDITKAKTIKDNIVLDSIEREKRALREICNRMGSNLNEMTCVQLKLFLESETKSKRIAEQPIDIVKHLLDDHRRLLDIAKKKGRYRSSTASFRLTATNLLKAFTKSDSVDVNKLTVSFVMSYIDWMKGKKPKLTQMCKKNTEIIGKALNELKYIHNDEDNGVIKITVNPFEKIKLKALYLVISFFLCNFAKSFVMNAIEFQSTVSDGIIRMPEQYRHKRFSNARVIVLTNNSRTAQKKEVHFTDFGLEMPVGYKFNREDANAR